MPLHSWNQWDPFRIDALGLVTLLGAPEVNNHVGKLVRSRYLEYLPLLGAYVIASDEFTDKQPGFQLYNIDKGIYTPDLAGWFTRWLMAQDIRTAASMVEWNVEAIPHSFKLDIIIGLGFCVIVNGGFLAITVLMGDWWGLANALSMAVSTIARAYLVDRNRVWIDQAVEKVIRTADPRAVGPVKPKSKQQKIDPTSISSLKRDKIVIVLSDARAVVMTIPAFLIVDCFVFNPKPPNATRETTRVKSLPPRQKQENKKQIKDPPQILYYRIFRAIAWIAFGAHVITIGMSTLVSQLFTVAVIVLPTVLMVYGIGSDDTRVGSRLRATIIDFPHVSEREQKRLDMYAFLNLTLDQEKSLRRWNVAPHKTNTEWWADYEEKKKLYNHDENGLEKPLIDMATHHLRERALRQRTAAASLSPQHTGSSPSCKHTSHSTA